MPELPLNTGKTPNDYAENNVYYLFSPTETYTTPYLSGVPRISDGSDPVKNRRNLTNGAPVYFTYPVGPAKADLEYNQSFDGAPYISLIINTYYRRDKIVIAELGIDTDNDYDFEVVCTFPPYHTIGGVYPEEEDYTMEEEYYEAYGEWQGGKPPAFVKGWLRLKVTMTSGNGQPINLYCGFDYKLSWCALPYMHTDLIPRAKIVENSRLQGFDEFGKEKVSAGDKIWFDASDSYDPNDDLNGNGKIDADETDRLEYNWVFGDGHTTGWGYANRNVSYTYSNNDIPKNMSYRIFEVNVTVRNLKWRTSWNRTYIKVYRGNHSPEIKSLKINNVEDLCRCPPPHVELVLDQSIKVHFSVYAIDKDGDALSYSWDFNFDGKAEIVGDQTTASNVDYSFGEPDFKPGLQSIILVVSDGTLSADDMVLTSVKLVINKPPVAFIRARRDRDPIDTFFTNNLTVRPNQIITFDASQSNDPDDLPGFDTNGDHQPDLELKYRWRFNIYDPTATSGWITNPTFTYSYLSAGKDNQYTVLLDVDDGLNVSTSENFTIYVNVRPEARIFIEPLSYNAQGNFEVGRPINFNGSASSDPNGDQIINYTWDFGDGNKSYEERPVYTYWTPSEYTVSLIVKDYEFPSLPDQVKIEIPNPPKAPIIRYEIYPLQTYTHLEVTFDASQTTDPDSAKKDLKFVWYFGDNTTSTEKNTTHRYLKAGEYLVTLEVTDETGIKAHKSEILIQVLNRKPIAIIRPLKNVPADEVVRVSGADSRDNDGYVMRYLWDFGDGTTHEWTTESTVQHEWIHPGKYTITLTVEDDFGHTGETQLEIRVTQAEEEAETTTNMILLGAIIAIIIMIVIILIVIIYKRSQKSI
jgi:PKD repeat protein